jgi:hypothetical protein
MPTQIEQNDMAHSRAAASGFFLGVMLYLSACSSTAPPTVPAPVDTYVVGLGEIMGLTQMRHAKLWFAGDAQNWPLVQYELDELKEGFEDAVRFHPHHKSVPQPLATMLPAFMDAGLAQLDAALLAKDHAQFVRAYDQLTISCNACHQAANFSFNRVIRPTSPPYSNQDFAPEMH